MSTPNKTDFVQDFGESNKNAAITLILDNGYQLKGLLTGFDGKNFRIITTQYADIESTVIQPAAKVSTYIYHKQPHFLSGTTSAPANTDFVQDFWNINKNKSVTIILDSGYHLKGLLTGFDGKNFQIVTIQYGGVEKTVIQPAAKVSTYIHCRH